VLDELTGAAWETYLTSRAIAGDVQTCREEWGESSRRLLSTGVLHAVDGRTCIPENHVRFHGTIDIRGTDDSKGSPGLLSVGCLGRDTGRRGRAW
jgi:hypothetical protein